MFLSTLFCLSTSPALREVSNKPLESGREKKATKDLTRTFEMIAILFQRPVYVVGVCFNLINQFPCLALPYYRSLGGLVVHSAIISGQSLCPRHLRAQVLLFFARGEGARQQHRTEVGIRLVGRLAEETPYVTRHDIVRHGEFLSLACPEVPPKGSPTPTGEVWLLKATPKNGPTPTQEGGWLLWLFTFGPNRTLVMSHKKI